MLYSWSLNNYPCFKVQPKHYLKRVTPLCSSFLCLNTTVLWNFSLCCHNIHGNIMVYFNYRLDYKTASLFEGTTLNFILVCVRCKDSAYTWNSGEFTEWMNEWKMNRIEFGSQSNSLSLLWITIDPHNDPILYLSLCPYLLPYISDMTLILWPLNSSGDL